MWPHLTVASGVRFAACVGLDHELLSNAGIDPSTIKALFLISCPLGIREEDFFGALAKRRWIGALARLMYRKVVMKNLRPMVGSLKEATKKTIRRDAEDASPLGWLSEKMKEKSSSSPFVHYSYAAEKDFFICRPHIKSLTDILGEENVQVLEMPVLGHFESHFPLADPTCEWHDAFRKTVSSL